MTCCGGLGAVFAATGLYGHYVEPHWIETVCHPLRLRNLPPILEGRIIVHLSDLHLGCQVEDGYLRSTFEMVKSLEPDIIVYSCDFTTYHPEVLGQARREFKYLPLAKFASLAVLGNHDYGDAISDFDHANRLVNVIEQNGVRVL